MGSFLQLTQYARRALVNTQNCCRWKIELVDALLDYDLIEFDLGLPYNQKLWRKLVVDEMKTYHQSIMRIPLCSGVRPISITNIMIFVKMLAERVPVLKRFMKGEPKPVDGWADFLRDQREFIESILFDTRAVSRGLFNQERIGIIVREHMTSRRNHTQLLLRLVSLELWFRLLEDKYDLSIFHI
jgi:hypothetical protein